MKMYSSKCFLLSCQEKLLNALEISWKTQGMYFLKNMAALFSQRNENKVMEEEQLALVLEDPADHGDLT